MFPGPSLLGSPAGPVPCPWVVTGPGVAGDERWQAGETVAPPLRLDIGVPCWVSERWPLAWNTSEAAGPLAVRQGILQGLL